MAAPVTQYVLKVHSRCDLACDHCYVYQHADQTWRGRPAALPRSTAEQAARRIAEHAVAHQLPSVQVILHGGEPLLLGRSRMRAVLAALNAGSEPPTRMDLRIHSNGVLLDEQWCALFDEFGVKVGVSLDGDQRANDRHRRFRDGRSSYPQARRALALLRQPAYRHLYAGILCTIDIGNDPIAVYEALLAERPPRLDLLLPHATWENPPDRPAGRTAPYADWLGQIFRRWTADGRPVPIRLFDSLISSALGGPSWSESVGLDPADLLVIETDGSWELPDSLKTAYHGAAATGLSVFAHPVDEVTRQPGFTARQRGLPALSATCRGCDVVRVCGGGLYAHRYRAGTGFGNPSVYCPDLKALIGDVTASLAAPAGPGARPRHTLGLGALEALAAGPGDVSAVRSLAQMRLSATRALVAAVATEGDGGTDPRLREAAAAGWALLCRLDAEAPGAVREVFAHPYTHAWAVRCLLRPAAGPPAGRADLDRAHLAGLAAAAALRAGISAELPVPVRDGLVHLPTMGALSVSADPAPTVLVSVAPGRVRAAGRAGQWQAARWLDTPGLRVQLEDSDPFRDCQTWPAADRLSAQQWRAWRTRLNAAGPRLAGTLPGYAKTLRAGLRTIVPLRTGPSGHRSGSAREAFGAIALALPRETSMLDALILHEFQHVKLHAVLDVQELFDRTDERRLPVPWRSDPRPLEGVLHGAYAHLALTHLSQSWGSAKRSRYLRYRSWVCATTTALAATGALTRAGERFVAGMHAAAEA